MNLQKKGKLSEWSQYFKFIIKAEQGERLCTNNDTKKHRELKSAFS